MKTFFAMFAAILCAAALLFGIQRYNANAEIERAMWTIAAQKGVETAELLASNMPVNGYAKAEDVEKFRDFVKSAREIIRRPKFPKDLARETEQQIKEAIAEVRHRLSTHWRSEEHLRIIAEL